jgi:hypothetical protein
MMRLYWPKENPPSLLDGGWKIPPVKEASRKSARFPDAAERSLAFRFLGVEAV